MNTRILSASFVAASLLGFGFTSASASPLACGEAINACVQGAKVVKKSIKGARNECQALRDCKKECRNTKKACKTACKATKGGRDCKKECRADKGSCVSTCKATYKTPECKQARKDVIKTLNKEGLACAGEVAKKCAP